MPRFDLTPGAALHPPSEGMDPEPEGSPWNTARTQRRRRRWRGERFRKAAATRERGEQRGSRSRSKNRTSDSGFGACDNGQLSI